VFINKERKKVGSDMNDEGGDEAYRHFDIIMFVDDSYLIRFPEEKILLMYKVCKKNIIGKA
jgi:hypothetical protein